MLWRRRRDQCSVWVRLTDGDWRAHHDVEGVDRAPDGHLTVIDSGGVRAHHVAGTWVEATVAHVDEGQPPETIPAHPTGQPGMAVAFEAVS